MPSRGAGASAEADGHTLGAVDTSEPREDLFARLHARVDGLVPGVEWYDHHNWEAYMKTLEDVQTWRGKHMVDADGDKVGTIEDIFLDRQTGEPAWAAVKTGLFGRKHTLVPIREAEVTQDDEIRVPFQKDQVKDAPNIDPDGELSPDEERQLWEHYGRSDYDEWQGDDRTRGLALPDEDAERARRTATETEAGDSGPVIVGVRLRRVVVVAVPAGEREPRQDV